MSTLGEYKAKLSFAVGTSETNLLTDDKRENAINRAVRSILEQCDVPEYRINYTLSFSSGVATYPTDCLRPVKLYNTTTKLEYSRVDDDKFDSQPAYTYNIYWDTSANALKVQIYPADTVSLRFRYLKVPTDMVDDGDSTRFRAYWDEAVTEKAAEILFTDTRNFQAAATKKEVAKDLIAKAWQTARMEITGEQDQKLTSVFVKRGLLNESRYSPLTTTQVMSQLAWLTIVGVTQQATTQFGYIPTNVALTTITLPTTATVGDLFAVTGQGAGGWKIAQGTGQQIIFGNQTTTLGTSGYLASTNANDSVYMVCTTANQIWTISPAPQGTITYV